jgi:hypothetical protein
MNLSTRSRLNAGKNGWLDADKEIAEHGIPPVNLIQSRTR